MQAADVLKCFRKYPKILSKNVPFPNTRTNNTNTADKIKNNPNRKNSELLGATPTAPKLPDRKLLRDTQKSDIGEKNHHVIIVATASNSLVFNAEKYKTISKQDIDTLLNNKLTHEMKKGVQVKDSLPGINGKFG